MSSPVSFCNQPPSATNAVTAVRPVPARRRLCHYNGSCSSSTTHHNPRLSHDNNVNGTNEECSTHHCISSFRSGSSFTVYEGRTFPLNQITSSLHSSTTDTDAMDDTSTILQQDDEFMENQNISSTLNIGSRKDSTEPPSVLSSPNNNHDDNFFLRPLLHQSFHRNNRMNANLHTSSSYRQHPSTSSSTILRVSPFEPIVNDRNFNGKISPLPQQEYRAWQKRREKHVEEVFHQQSQPYDRNDVMVHHRATTFQRPVAVSPMEMDEKIHFV